MLAHGFVETQENPVELGDWMWLGGSFGNCSVRKNTIVKRGMLLRTGAQGSNWLSPCLLLAQKDNGLKRHLHSLNDEDSPFCVNYRNIQCFQGLMWPPESQYWSLLGVLPHERGQMWWAALTQKGRALIQHHLKYKLVNH
jgi:hypothetical protein